MGIALRSNISWDKPTKIHNLSDVRLRWEPYIWSKRDGSRKPLKKLYLEIPPGGSKKLSKRKYCLNIEDYVFNDLRINVFPASLTPEDRACSSMDGDYIELNDEIKINYVPGGRIEFVPRLPSVYHVFSDSQRQK